MITTKLVFTAMCDWESPDGSRGCTEFKKVEEETYLLQGSAGEVDVDAFNANAMTMLAGNGWSFGEKTICPLHDEEDSC